MSIMLDQFRAAVLAHRSAFGLTESLRISSHERLAAYYAPFEYINKSAKVVLLGITPGQSQAAVALEELRRQLTQSASDSEALKAAKETASFSGGMRTALVEMLDSIGLPRALGIDGCAELFSSSRNLIHYTSALRHPVLLDGKDFSGKRSIRRTPYLLQMVDSWLADEAAQLPDAVWIPLGPVASGALEHLVAKGGLKESRVLAGIPHPSGQNAERISYFLGRKAADKLSRATNPAILDRSRTNLVEKLSILGSR